MKKTKRLLSLLLAAALAGQMGVVAWGTGGAATPTDCESKGHGSLQRVTAACTENHAHWLESDSTKVINGGSGDNYFFVKPGDSVTCGTGGSNFIILDPDDFANNDGFNLLNFRTGTNDKIYVLDKKTVSPIISTNNPYEVTIDGKTIQIVIAEQSISDTDFVTEEGVELAALKLKLDGTAETKKGATRKITTNLTVGVGTLKYDWEKYADAVK